MIESSRSPGRPRSDAARQSILEAAFRMMADRGYEGMAIEAVADAAGVGKTTIYRWWRSKADLAVEAFFEATKAELRFPETGSARQDFRCQIVDLARLLRGSRGAVLAATLGGARVDRDLARALGERWLEPRRRWGLARMQKAVADGECHSGVDIAAALGILYGPLYTPLLFGQPVPGEAQVAAHLDLALGAIFK